MFGDEQRKQCKAAVLQMMTEVQRRRNQNVCSPRNYIKIGKLNNKEIIERENIRRDKES